MTRPTVWKMLLYTVALFVAGGICGAMLMARFAPVPAAPQPLQLGRTGEIAAKIRTKLDSRLQLTAEQQKQFDPLIVKTSAELECVHKDCLDRITAALEQMHDAMRSGLTTNQLQLLTGLETERRQLMWQKYNYPPAATNSSAH